MRIKDEQLKNNLYLISECLMDDDLTDVSKLVVISSIVNPAPIEISMMLWVQEDLVDVESRGASVAQEESLEILSREGGTLPIDADRISTDVSIENQECIPPSGVVTFYVNSRKHKCPVSTQYTFEDICKMANQDPEHSRMRYLSNQDDDFVEVFRWGKVSMRNGISIQVTHTDTGKPYMKERSDRPITFMLNGEETYTDLRYVSAEDICNINGLNPAKTLVIFQHDRSERHILEYYDDDLQKPSVAMAETGMKFWTAISKDGE